VLVTHPPDTPPAIYLAVCKSPKSWASPVLAIVIKSIVVDVEGVGLPIITIRVPLCDAQLGPVTVVDKFPKSWAFAALLIVT
jgi:hypothetical protein